MSDQVLLPVFLKLEGRRVLLVGGGGVAATRLGELTRAGAHVTVVAPEIRPAILSFGGVIVLQREFAPSDLDGAWFVVAAATPEVNRQVAAAAEDAPRLRERGRRRGSAPAPTWGASSAEAA